MAPEQTPQYPLGEQVKEELLTLQRELAEPGARDGVAAATSALSLPPDLAIAVLYRAARRSGLTIRLLTEEIRREVERGRSQPHAT